MWCPTSMSQLAEVERRLFAHLPDLLVRDTPVCGGAEHIHTVELVRATTMATAPQQQQQQQGKEKKPAPLVLVHGYGFGLGMWAHNLAPLADRFGRVLALDWLGCGASSRPAFTARGVDAAEAFFVDSLEEWRAAQEPALPKMTLMGHSLGGYLAVAYTERYPQRVERLLLASPVGVPRKPEEDAAALAARPLKWRALIGTFRALWGWGATPQSIVRALGPWGPRVARGYVDRRMRDNDAIDKELLGDYIYHVSAQSGSGEFALNEILEPGAWARRPLADRLGHLLVPTHYIYGARDWMDFGAAVAVCEGEGSQHGESVLRVADAGHMLTCDNPYGFNACVLKCVGLLATATDRTVDVGSVIEAFPVPASGGSAGAQEAPPSRGVR